MTSWLDVKEVAARVCCSPGNVWKLARKIAGFPKPYRLGPKKTRFRAADVEKYVEGCK